MPIEISQAEADALLRLNKHYLDHERFVCPGPGASLRIPLFSDDRREEFMMDLYRGRIELAKATMQNRARKAIILVRVDLGGAPHRNPDGTEVPAPHIHLYQEGFGDKWAYPLPDHFTDASDIRRTFDEFMEYCNVITRPNIQWGLF